MTNYWSTDWLGTNPVFFNTKTKKVSHNINDVIDIENLEFDAQGLNNYLRYSYSVFGQTPIKNVKFLLPNSALSIENGEFVIHKKEDPADKYFGKISKEEDVLADISSAVKSWESSIKGDITIPTSGGYDSRILNLMVGDKSRIRSFTYGISRKQEESFEIVYAKKFCESQNIKWQSINLGEFNRYNDEWYDIYGVSTGTFGTYHIEFYNKIKSVLQDEQLNLLSGIVGDAWAGAINKKPINNIDDVILLGHSHGVSIDKRHFKLKSDNNLEEQFWQENKEKLQEHYYQIIQLVRFKMIFLSYLLKVPQHLGFNAWSPFVKEEICCAMMNISQERRADRLWQKEFFRKHGANVEEDSSLKAKKSNYLDLYSMYKTPLKPLDSRLLSRIVDEKYVESINKNLYSGFYPKRFLQYNFLSKDENKQKHLNAYNAYTLLKPIEILLARQQGLIKIR